MCVLVAKLLLLLCCFLLTAVAAMCRWCSVHSSRPRIQSHALRLLRQAREAAVTGGLARTLMFVVIQKTALFRSLRAILRGHTAARVGSSNSSVVSY